MAKQDISIFRLSFDFKNMFYIFYPGLKNSSGDFPSTRAAVLLINSFSYTVCCPPTIGVLFCFLLSTGTFLVYTVCTSSFPLPVTVQDRKGFLMHTSICYWPVQRAQTTVTRKCWPRAYLAHRRGVTQVKWRFGLVLSALIRAKPFLQWEISCKYYRYNSLNWQAGEASWVTAQFKISTELNELPL